MHKGERTEISENTGLQWISILLPSSSNFLLLFHRGRLAHFPEMNTPRMPVTGSVTGISLLSFLVPSQEDKLPPAIYHNKAVTSRARLPGCDLTWAIGDFCKNWFIHSIVIYPAHAFCVRSYKSKVPEKCSWTTKSSDLQSIFSVTTQEYKHRVWL